MNIKKIEKEFEELMNQHLYTMVDYSISSRKIDNKILTTTSEKIINDVWKFLKQAITQVVESMPNLDKEKLPTPNPYGKYVKVERVNMIIDRCQNRIKQWKKKVLKNVKKGFF